MVHVLVVDDDATTRLLVARRLEKQGFVVATSRTGADALGEVRAGFRGVIVLDLQLPDADGRTLLPELREESPDSPIIILTGHGSVDAALDSLREGAFDFLDKASLGERLVPTVRRAAETLTESGTATDGDADAAWPGIVARSPQMRAVFRSLRSATDTRMPVLVRGESGTGKELIARAVHDHGPRSSGPFVAVNCAAIPENLLEAELFGHERGAFTGAVGRKAGRFELARGGTLFLDEIGEMHPMLQAKLLRVLQNGEFQRLGGTETLTADVRVISATHRDLEAEVEHGRFREDLYYRLAVFTVYLPALRDRTGDLDLLIQHFLDEAAEREDKERPKLDPLARELLTTYSYPGNVRELQNVLAHAMVSTRGGVLALSDLPEAFMRAAAMERRRGGAEDAAPAASSQPDGGSANGGSANGGYQPPGPDAPFPTLAELELEHVHAALERSGGNKAEAARLLGISRMTLYRKLERESVSK